MYAQRKAQMQIRRHSDHSIGNAGVGTGWVSGILRTNLFNTYDSIKDGSIW